MNTAGQEGKPKRSLEFHFFRGSAWNVSFRWAVRLLGLINTIVLARLLTPADFGVVAIAMILAAAIEVFSQSGAQLVIVRHDAPTRDHYNSAWTVSVIMGLLLGAAIWATAPLTYIYFHEPRAAAVVHVVAFRTALGGFENIGVANFQRQFRFRARFAYGAAPSIVAFVVTISCALWLRNYWALVAGIMSQQIASVALSYLLEPYRPSIAFNKIHEIWSFSGWYLIRAVGSYLNGQIDKLAVGGFGGAAMMGHYEVATDVATSPSVEINQPMIATLFPVITKVKHDHARRRDLYVRALAWSAVICSSTSVGVALVSSDMVDLVLGNQWADTKPLMPWLALGYGVLGLTMSMYSLLDVMNRQKTAAIMQWTRVIALFGGICPVAYFLRSPHAVAITRFAVTAAVTPTLFMAAARVMDIRVRDLLLTLWRPFAASSVMAGIVTLLNAGLSFTGPTRLMLDVSAGALTYGTTLMTMWLLTGRPDGPESVLWPIGMRILNSVKLRRSMAASLPD